MASIMTRPQVGIERLPSTTRRTSGADQRESMNCKSCRKRKIKCNRLRPTCEACKIFQCSCLYDAIPKKRGPKTDVLEALVRRIDGLEKKLADEKKNPQSASATSPSVNAASSMSSGSPVAETATTSAVQQDQHQQQQQQEIDIHGQQTGSLFPPLQQSPRFGDDNEVLIDAYFAKVQDRPFHILDEATTRRRYHLGQLPQCLRLAIFAVGARFADNNGHATAVHVSERYAHQARALIDVDEPSIEGLQTLLLIHRAFFAAGKGRRSYMILSMAIGMAMAMDFHREVSIKSNISTADRELRRSLFWACYLMDRFAACGSRRPSLISDNSMSLRLPSWVPHPGARPTEGEYFSVQTNLQHTLGTGQICQSGNVLLIDIARILGETNRYLANGGVKGDSHFPWHALSNLSKIRQALDFWASGNQDLFADIELLLAQPDSVVLVLSKMIYHVIHCLIYRPFLPIDLAELRGTGQHQSWQIEATNLCFLHANAIADLTRISRQTTIMEWPAFAGYCICTAGTVHVHGAHYKGQEGEIFCASADYLSQEVQILSDLRYQWACTQDQRDTLQSIYVAHSDLVKALASNPLRFSTVFHLEDFFDRYPGHYFNGAHVSFTDVAVESTTPPPSAIIQQYSFQQQQQQQAQLQQQQSFPPTPDDNTPAVGSHMPAPLTPAVSQSSHLRRYNDSAVSLSTVTSCDDKLPPPMAHVAPDFGAFTAAFSPGYTFAAPPNGVDAAPFDPALFATSPAAEGVDRVYDFGNGGAGQAGEHAGQGGGQGQKIATPGGRSQSVSTRNEDEKDPFLMLLEQLAENEHSRGGPRDLDFYLGDGQG